MRTGRPGRVGGSCGTILWKQLLWDSHASSSARGALPRCAGALVLVRLGGHRSTAASSTLRDGACMCGWSDGRVLRLRCSARGWHSHLMRRGSDAETAVVERPALRDNGHAYAASPPWIDGSTLLSLLATQSWVLAAALYGAPARTYPTGRSGDEPGVLLKKPLLLLLL